MPITNNLLANQKESRCTLQDGSEINYYEREIIPKISNLVKGNRLALKKLDALKTVITQRSKTGPVVLRNERVAEILDDFTCRGNPFMCIKNDPDNEGQRLTIGFEDDQDLSRDEPGFFDDAGVWQELPSYGQLPGYLLSRLSLTSSANTTAREGMVSFFNGDNSDDPSNPLYEPAFDPEEADLIYEAAKGNFSVLGGLNEPEDGSDDASDDAAETNDAEN